MQMPKATAADKTRFRSLVPDRPDVETPFGPAERPMGGYLALPEAWAQDLEAATPWLERALEHVSTLPPKKRR